MMIPEETVTTVRQNTNIADVVSQYVQLKKKGKNQFGFCPFHDERTPSFSVTEEKQIFHCFSCGRGGNVFSFLMEVEGLSFPEAVIKTAELSNVKLDESLLQNQKQQQPAEDSRQAKLLKAHEESAQLFHHILMNTKVGEQALDYLIKRGLSRETIETFEIGFSPKERTVLLQYLKGKEYSNDSLEESGLFVVRENQEWIDRFSGRIMFPIRNHQGKVVAFSGRIFEQDELDRQGPKYLNSPETMIFNKRKVLFNYDLARSSIRREKEVVLFEGFMDVIAAWQAGVRNGIASMGTSLTEEHIHLLDRITDHVVIAYDGDNAGVEATKRAAEVLNKETHFDIEVMSFSEGLDPDEFIQQKGAEAFQNLLLHGRDTLFTFKMKFHRRNANLNNESERLGYIDTVLHELLTVTSAVEREMYLRQLSTEFGFSLESLQEQFQQGFYEQRNRLTKEKKQRNTEQKPIPAFPQVHAQKRKIDAVEHAERLLLYRLFHFEEAWFQAKNLTNEIHFVHDEYQMLYILLESFREHTGTQASIDSFMDFVKESELKKIIAEIEMITLSEEIKPGEIEDYIDVITRKSVLQTQLKEKQAEMTEASRKGDREQQRILMLEVVNLKKQLIQEQVIQ